MVQPKTKVEIVTAGHSLQIAGLSDLLEKLQEWPELRRITVGKVCGRHKGGRGGSGRKRMAVVRNDQEDGSARSVPKVGHAVRKGGGGKQKSIELKASGYAKVGDDTIVGIACRASTASAQQLLLLLPPDGQYQPLLARLVREKCCTWQQVGRW